MRIIDGFPKAYCDALRLFDADVLFEPSYKLPCVCICFVESLRRGSMYRNPNFRRSAQTMETAGQDAGDCVLPGIESDWFADDRRVPTKAAFPKSMADHSN